MYTYDVGGHTVPGRTLSPLFTVGGFELQLDLRSDQVDEGIKGFTGLFLHMKKGWKALVKYELQIISANDSSVSMSRSSEYTYERLLGSGARSMLSNETMKTYLNEDGEVTVRAKISIKMPNYLNAAEVLT
jgi:hypothetical protein